jgi:hypothetical protein
MPITKQRNAVGLNAKLSLIKEGEHWNKDLKPGTKEKMLFRNPDPEEKNTEMSKAALAQMPISFSTKRDVMIDYMNPREELPKFDKTIDQIPAFDEGPVSLLRPYDHEARQSVNQVIRGRTSYVLEEGKYDITIDNQKEKAEAIRSKEMAPSGIPSQRDPGVTRAMAAELRRQSLMETTQSL